MDIDRKRDLVFCFLALLVSTVIGITSLRYQIASSYFPLLLVLFLGAMATLLLVQTLKGPNSDKPETDLKEVHVQLISFVKVFGTILAYVAVITVVGYPIATVLFLVLTMSLFGERRWIWIGLVAIGMTVMLVSLFFQFLGVSPPESMLSLL